MLIFLSRKGDLVSANKRRANLQKENILAAFWINIQNFQKIFGNRWRSFGNIPFFFKSSKKIYVYLGFYTSPPLILFFYHRSSQPNSKGIFFLLLMEENLAEVMKGMSLGEDKSIIIPEDDDYCAIKSGG